MGIYRHLQKSNRYNIICQLGETEVKNSVAPTSAKCGNFRLFGETDIEISEGPILAGLGSYQTRWHRFLNLEIPILRNR